MSMTENPYRKTIEAWRTQYEQSLTAPHGWLAIIGLLWLQEGANPFGTDPANPIILPPGSTTAQAGSFVMQNGSVTLKAQDDSEVLVVSIPKNGSSRPITVGRLTLYVIQRGEMYGVRIYDPESSARWTFTGVRWFPIDEHYCFQATFVPFDDVNGIAITNILGMTEDSPCPGYVRF